MQTNATLALSGICLGINLAGLSWVAYDKHCGPVRLILALVYGLFLGVFLMPLVTAFAPALYLFYFPTVLIMLLALPATLFQYIVVKTPKLDQVPLGWRDGILPLADCIVTVGF